MRRTDRLFEIIQLFRGGRLLLGRDIAARLEVSLRTIYRDIETLVASGVPIEGERGVGYILRAPIFLPPLTLTHVELEALHLGMQIVRGSKDADLAEAATQLLLKIDAVLPDTSRVTNHLTGLSVYGFADSGPLIFLGAIRHAISTRMTLSIAYTRLDGTETSRTIRPLHVEYWGNAWTCTAWCNTRDDFRVFRIDRISDCKETGDIFSLTAGKTYADYLDGLPPIPEPAHG